MPIDAKLVKSLRDKTGAGFLDCRTALEEVRGNLDEAEKLLRKKGIARAERMQTEQRVTLQGRVGSYVHYTGKTGVLVELCCQSDSAAMSDVFSELLKDLCLQVAAIDTTRYVSRDQIPAEALESVRKAHSGEIEGKPPEVAEKILQLEKNFYSEVCLLDQPFVNPEKFPGTVGDLIKAKINQLGESVTVRRFVRMQLGR